MRTILVTGAAGGIGQAVVRRLLRDRAHVVCVDLNLAGLHEAFSNVDDVTLLTADVTDETDVVRAIDAAAARGRFDALVNTAGITPRGALTEITMDEWDRTLNTCLRSAVLCAKYALPHLVAETAASLISIASIHQRVVGPRLPAYAAAKAGLVALTRQLAVDYGRLGVRCNVISPGFIETPATTATLEGTSDVADMQAATPSTRLGLAEDVAAAVAFLAGPDAGFINGAELVIDGGASLVHGASLLRPALQWRRPSSHPGRAPEQNGVQIADDAVAAVNPERQR